MIEHKTRGEQLFEQSSADQLLPNGGNLLKGKAAKAFESIRGLLRRPGASSGGGFWGQAKKGSVLPGGNFSAHKLDLKVVNQTLVLILIGLVALTIYFVVGKSPDIFSITAAVPKIEFEGLENETIIPFRELAFYLNQIKTRDIFNEYEEPKPPPRIVEHKEPPPPPKVTIQEKAKDLKLMGISWGDDPTAILRNDATQAVLFLKEGEKIKGTEIKIKEIHKTEVILSSDGDEMRML